MGMRTLKDANQQELNDRWSIPVIDHGIGKVRVSSGLRIVCELELCDTDYVNIGALEGFEMSFSLFNDFIGSGPQLWWWHWRTVER
jgi:hypothetical protein